MESFSIVMSILVFMFTCIAFIFARGESKHKCITNIKVDLSEIKTDIKWIKKAINEKQS